MEKELVNCIISIDVGVKNLAICVLGKTKTNVIHVLYWKWYNVVSTGDETTTPSKEQRKRKTKKEKEQMGKCINVIRKTGKPCGRPGPINSRGRSYCGVHNPEKKHNPHDTQEWCYGMLQSLPNITADIMAALEPWKNFKNALQVVIEQQSVDNKKILLQSHLIYGHFVAHFDNRIPVRFVPAYHKLLVYDGPDIACTLKTAYAKRKFLAKKHTEYFLQGIPGMNTQWKAFFDSCKTKQDDISDAFLQGLYLLKGGATVKKDDVVVSGKKRRKVRF